MIKPFLLNTQEAASILKLSAAHVKRLCHDGKISAVKSKEKWVIHYDSIQAYIDERRSPKKTETTFHPRSKREMYIDLFIYGKL